MEDLIEKYYSEQFRKKDVEEIIKSAKEKMQQLVKGYNDGLIIREELNRSFQDIVWESLKNYLLCLKINTDSWKRLQEDYESFQKGEKPVSMVGEPWYRCKHNYFEQETLVLDKTNFFRLIEEFKIPIDYFQPHPEDIEYPNRFYTPKWDLYGIGPCIWNNDGGLISKDFKIGDTITLIDHYGLKSVIRNIRPCMPEEQKGNIIHFDYTGLGTIEGYTSSREREINIIVRNGRIDSLYCYMDEDDKNVYDSFPLWEKARRYEGNKKNLKNIVIESLINDYLL